MWRRTCLCLCLLLAAAVQPVLANPQIVAKGLFSGRALLEINGAERIVRVGETTAEGVLLVSSNSKEAVVEVNGVSQTLSLSNQISASFVESDRVATVTIPRGDDSHYRIKGAINGYPVEMMVDTGATAVAISGKLAAQWGIDFRKGQRGQSNTAGGMVDSYLVDFHKVSVGSIEVRNIKGLVVEGDYPVQPLLGNTFLNHVTMEQQADTLVLKRKY